MTLELMRSESQNFPRKLKVEWARIYHKILAEQKLNTRSTAKVGRVSYKLTSVGANQK